MLERAAISPKAQGIPEGDPEDQDTLRQLGEAPSQLFYKSLAPLDVPSGYALGSQEP